MAFEVGADVVLVDAGLMFSRGELPGVDIVLPDLSYVKQQANRLRAVLLTHGHEDHLGALPSLLRELPAPVPVYGTPFTLGLLRAKLEEAGVAAELREIGPREPFHLGEAFTVEALQVSHSVPDSVGYLLATPEGTAIHTGDFKIDPSPADGRLTDLERIERAGEEGVLCLLSDSTNAEVPSETGSERTVAEAFERLLPQAPGRVVVSLFASNVLRIRHLLELAARTGRKVALNGRSLARTVELASRLGYLRPPPDLIVPLEAVLALPPRQVLLLTTGSQAEPRSGLLQMLDPERDLRIERGDLVVMSSRVIPGNERAVFSMFDRLAERGARVVHPGVEPAIHVSGHASRDQQRRVLELVRPEHFVPIHGEARHLHAHLSLAREASVVRDAGLHLARDGDVLELAAGRGGVVGRVPAGRLFQDRLGGGEVFADALREREKLALTGVVVVVVALDSGTGALAGAPRLSSLGLTGPELALLPRAAEECRSALLALSAEVRGNEPLVREELIRAVRRTFREYTSKRPTVMPVVVKL